MLLVSAPYALKAGDAETIGGLPPSAFVLAAPAPMNSSTAGGAAETITPLAATDVTTTGGIANYLPIFSGAAAIIDSAVFQTGSGATAKVGISTTTPATKLDVNGNGTIRGILSLPATAAATATAGKISQPLDLVASSFDKTSNTALAQTFRFQAEPAGNDTTAPSALSIYSTDWAQPRPPRPDQHHQQRRNHLRTGPEFPGDGLGTITGVTAGTALTGGGTAGTVTLNLDTTKVPVLSSTNTFTATQSLSNGDLSLAPTTQRKQRRDQYRRNSLSAWIFQGQPKCVRWRRGQLHYHREGKCRHRLRRLSRAELRQP